MRHGLALSATFLLLTTATLGPKLLAVPKLTDDARLGGEVAKRLRSLGFAARVVPLADPNLAVFAGRGNCRVLVRNGEQGRVLQDLFAMMAKSYGPVSYGYRGMWTASPPTRRPLLETFGQQRLAGLGFVVSRPAVLALAVTPSCRAINSQLDGLRAYPLS